MTGAGAFRVSARADAAHVIGRAARIFQVDPHEFQLSD
jgi:hypothetical protein